MQVADSETGASGIASVPTKVRWVVMAGMTGSVVVAYLTRAALAPAGSSIQNELHLSNSELGEILGIWAAGYIGFQLPGGWLGDRWGRRLVAADLRAGLVVLHAGDGRRGLVRRNVVVAAGIRHGPGRADPMSDQGVHGLVSPGAPRLRQRGDHRGNVRRRGRR